MYIKGFHFEHKQLHCQDNVIIRAASFPVDKLFTGLSICHLNRTVNKPIDPGRQLMLKKCNSANGLEEWLDGDGWCYRDDLREEQ